MDAHPTTAMIPTTWLQLDATTTIWLLTVTASSKTLIENATLVTLCHAISIQEKVVPSTCLAAAEIPTTRLADTMTKTRRLSR